MTDIKKDNKMKTQNFKAGIAVLSNEGLTKEEAIEEILKMAIAYNEKEKHRIYLRLI